MTLAVATRNPNSVAETYVRQHMRLIRPGATVGIGLDCADAPAVGIPVFCVRKESRGMAGKLDTALRFLRTGYGAAIPRHEEARLEAFLREHRVEAVLAEFGTTGCALRALCRRLGLSLFVNFHGHDATVLGQRRDIRFAYRLLGRDARKFFCGSCHFAKIVEGLGIPRRKIEVIPCGIEIDDFSTRGEKDSDLILAIGRLTRKKRPDLTIRAFAIARRARPSLRLEIIGDGSERPACEAAVRELGLGKSVTLLGARPHDEVKSRLAKAGIFVQHSVTAENGDEESQGISLLEAMASGIPVVATDHNGFSETVIHEATGLLSPEGDVEAMAGNILRLVRDPALARRMGELGRARVEAEFDAFRLAARLREVMFDRESASGATRVRLKEARE
jgi:glycosyltransferase involved in cell wall biosynthesis